MIELLVVSSIALWLLVLFNLILSLALVRRLNATGARSRAGLKVGQRAPDFAAETPQGKRVSRMDYLGRTVAFVFVSPTCAPCRELLPEMKGWAAQAARAGVDIVLVSSADKESTRSMIEEFELDMSLVVAPGETNRFLDDFRVGGTPYFVVVGPQGQVVSTGFPSLTDSDWRQLVLTWQAELETAAVAQGKEEVRQLEPHVIASSRQTDVMQELNN